MSRRVLTVGTRQWEEAVNKIRLGYILRLSQAESDAATLFVARQMQAFESVKEQLEAFQGGDEPRAITEVV